MQEYQALWVNYANFRSCTSCRGYWMAILFNFLAILALLILSSVFEGLSFLYSLYNLAIFIPGLAISVRRLRDAGYHWAWLFIAFVPVIGFIWLIVLFCKPSVYTGIEQV